MEDHQYSTRSKTKTAKTVPRLKPLPYQEIDLYSKQNAPAPAHGADITVLGEKQEFFTSEDHPFNKKNYKYKACRPNPYSPSTLYGTSELEPHGVRLSYFDRSPGCFTDKTMSRATTDLGWRSCRTNVGLREGSWYVEFRVLCSDKTTGNHVRLGVGRREAALEAPVGFDGYGYGIRDLTGEKIHLSRPAPFMECKDGAGFKTGDVIGMLIELPSLAEQKTLIEKRFGVEQRDIFREQIPIKYKNNFFFEQFEYAPSKQMEHMLNPMNIFGEKAVLDKTVLEKPLTMPDSHITFYKNGGKQGRAFTDLYAFLPPCSELKPNVLASDDGSLGYYPMISCYKGGCCEINSGALDFTPSDLAQQIASGKVKLLSDRFNERVTEEYVWDLVDEVESAYLDNLEV